MLPFGLLRVAAATPQLRVADCPFNVTRHVDLLQQAQQERVYLLVFPELSLTGYTCADLFHHDALLHGALRALHELRQASTVFDGLIVAGLPLNLDDQVFNAAAVLHKGQILGIVPKSFLPNYKEFYERRWFAPAATARSHEVRIDGQSVPFGTDLLFRAQDVEGLVVGVEICEDLWVPIPPSSAQALAGGTVLCNPSASNEVIGKANYRRQLVVNQSGRCMAAYVYSSCGVWESTTDVVFGGHCLVAENGTLLGESKRFQRQPHLTIRDVDLDRLRVDRLRTNSFGEAALYVSGVRRDYRVVTFNLVPPSAPTLPLKRTIEAHPFVPSEGPELRDRCAEIFHTQVAGLAKRLEHGNIQRVAIGVSGGLDSTLALVVTCKTFDALGWPRANIQALTMPGFGTTSRTKKNALSLTSHLGVTCRDVDVRQLCLDEWRALGHRPFGIDLKGHTVESLTALLCDLPKDKRHDLVFENVQARMRTSLLMNTAFVVGTGDVSELALGWCTYNADQTSMYNPNSSIPKTLVKFLVDWAARNEFDGPARETLLDITQTPISPELLPTGAAGEIVQETEGTVGPYELHDFFLYQFLRYGAPPEKILFLASQANFNGVKIDDRTRRPYTPDEIRRWLATFIRRFFGQQFKRSCLPDGPKVGSVSLSPRGDWRMPSDASAALWLEWAERQG
jgi:NAD+ synthase (glutamine-hydrolysing)